MKNSLFTVLGIGIAYAATTTLTSAQADVTMPLIFPRAIASRVIDAVAHTYGYEDEVCEFIDEGEVCSPNPLAKRQFVRRWMYDLLYEIVDAYEQDQAGEQARENAHIKVQNEIVFPDRP